MMARAFHVLLALAAVALLSIPASGRNLYAATVDTSVTGDGAGRLYVVNPVTGKSMLVGPIRIGERSLAIDGLAVHPKTGVLYGITWRASREPCLVTIDPRTARAERVGPLGVRGTDIHFDSQGTLYIWIADSHQLGTVNLHDGTVTLLPASHIAETAPGGLAINSRGLALVTATANASVIDEVDPTTGELVGGLALVDASILGAVYALTYIPTGALLAVNQSKSRKAGRELVSIDPETGSVTRIGALPDGVDAIAIDDGPPGSPRSKWPLLVIMLAILVVLHVAGFVRWRHSG